MTPIETRDRLQRELRKPNLSDSLTRIRLEQGTRKTLFVKPPVVYWREQESDPGYFGLKPPPGSVTLYWALKNSRVIRQLEYSHAAHSIERLESIHERMVADYQTREMISIDSATEQMLSRRSFFTFRYAGKQLASNLWLSDEAMCGSLVFPYNGGRLDSEDFLILEHLNGGRGAFYDTLVVVSPPTLSDIERAAVNAVPSSQRELHLTSAALCFSACALVTIALFVTAGTAVTGCCLTFQERLAAVSLEEETLERLGATASAEELLEMRRKIFDEFGVL